MIKRNEVTDLLVGLIEQLGIRCGAHVAPNNVGWDEGEPNKGAFIPYCVVKTNVTRTERKPLRTETWDWSLAYQMTVWSPDPATTDDLIGLIGERFLRFGRCAVSGFVLDYVQVEQVSGLSANKQFNPYLWQATLSLTVYAMRSREPFTGSMQKQTPDLVTTRR